MITKVTSNKIAGVPDQSGWVQIHDFTPATSESLSLKGRLFALTSIQRKLDRPLKQGEDLIIGREILTRLHEVYYNTQGNQFKLLTSAVEDVFKTFNSPNETLQILAAVIIGNKIILAGIGKVEAWVKRSAVLSKIIHEGNSISSASGILHDQDEFFLGTSSYFAKITPQILKSANPLEVASALESTLAALSIKIAILPDVPNISTPPTAAPALARPKPISPVRLVLAGFIDKILALLPKPNRKAFVKDDLINPHEFNKKKQVASTAGAVLLVLLIISIVFGLRQKKISDSKSTYQGILVSASHNLAEAQSLSTIDEAKARELILSAKSQIDALKSKKIKDPDIDALAAKISQSMGQIAGIYQQNPVLYLDLSLITSGFVGTDITVSDGRMVVLDKTAKRLESIDIASSAHNPVAGPDIMPDAGIVAAYSDRNFVSASDGIWEIGTTAKNVIPKDKDMGNNILISAYAGNFYILDKDHSTVWRYQGDSGVFTSKSNWFGANVSPDLSNVISWTIDGNIWMLTQTGDILKFSAGSPVNFMPKGLDKNLSAIDIFTSQDSKYLYLLDHDSSRVLVIGKDGVYKAQYIGDNIKNATKIIVSEDDKKIILLEGSNLYSLDIKHL